MDLEAKKLVLRRLTNGLYALGVRGPAEAHVTLVSWLTQVSVEPPLVVVAIRRESQTLDLVRWSSAFGISVLEKGAEALASRLGRATSEAPDKLKGVEVRSGPVLGVPLLAASVGWLECRVVDQMSAGDHVAFLAEVVEAGLGTDGQPLVAAEVGWRYGG